MIVLCHTRNDMKPGARRRYRIIISFMWTFLKCASSAGVAKVFTGRNSQRRNSRATVATSTEVAAHVQNCKAAEHDLSKWIFPQIKSWQSNVNIRLNLSLQF